MPDEPLPSSARTPETPAGRPPPWPPWLRFLFRFAFCYFLLYTLPTLWRFSLIGFIPGTGVTAQAWSETSRNVLAWVAARYFGIYDTGNVLPLMGVEIFVLLFLALLGALIWSLLDRKRTDYVTLQAWFRVWLRYTLAFTLFLYGFAKIFPVQMTFSRLSLIQRWGNFSSFDALWAFMAASQPYQIFSGVMEVLPGLLLLFRRTTPLGAAMALAVMINVTALDYCYDISPKIYATHLALISLFLLIPDARRLANVFIFNRAAAAAELSRPVFPRLWMRIGARLLWALLVISVIGRDIRADWMRYKDAYVDSLPSVHGLYSVETFTRNGRVVPPLVTDPNRWQWIDVSARQAQTVSMTEDWSQCNVRIDTNKNSLTLTSGTNVYAFKYSWPGTNSGTNYLDLRGTMGTNSLELHLRKADLGQFPLIRSKR